MLNAAFLSGEIPDQWNTSMVTPIYKKGDATDTANYRPIAGGESVMRLLGILLNDRLVESTETHDLRSPVQAGFRPALSCRQPLMTLQHFIDQQVQHNKGQLFCCFVDLKGAYDSVPRKQLWQTRAGLGIHGNMLKGIKAMYNNSQVVVKVAGRHGNMHKPCLGVKQGCPLSPTFFGLYMDGLFEYVQSVEGGSGPRLSSGQRVSALMYADDIVLMSTTVEGLQRLINATAQYCHGKGMTSSPAWMAVVVFCSNSHKVAWEHTWTCDGAPLQQCDVWKYLGLVFTATPDVASGMLEMQRRQIAAASRSIVAAKSGCITAEAMTAASA